MIRTYSMYALTMKATQLRADLYKVLDRVIESGKPVEIERKGRRLKIVPAAKVFQWEHLVQRPGNVVGEPEDLVHMDWSKEWKPFT